jgi:twitching motility two-component system response regulator PilG
LSREEAFTLYQKGLAAIKKGDKSQARRLLIRSVQLDARNEHAWLWLAGVAGSSKETEGCLRRVLALNPNNEWAQVGLAKILDKQHETAAAWKCPLNVDGMLQQIEQCANCRAVFSLNKVDALLDHPDVNCPQLLDLAERYSQQSVEDRDFDRHYALALVYLNIKAFERAAPHLQALALCRPFDHQLLVQVDQLLARIHPEPAQKPEPEPETRVKGTVMLVDDSATVRKLVEIVLKKENYGVISASNGMEALTLLGDQRPDLILLDISMPHIDGYTLCRLIKSDEKTKNIPVVMLSGKDGFFDKVRGKMSGSTDFITKPFDPDTFTQVLARYIKVKEA